MEASNVVECKPLSDHVCTCGQEKLWKYLQPPPRERFKPKQPLKSNISMSNETTSKLSYPYPNGFQMSKSFKPKTVLPRYDIPIGQDTTNSLSYVQPAALPIKEQYPWAMRRYVPSTIKMARDTVYQMSYAPPGEFVQIDGCYCSYS